MDNNPEKLVHDLLIGNPRSIARIISLIEDNAAVARRCLELLFPHTGRAQVIGITGAPGAGKSTLVDEMVCYLSAAGKRVGVLAVDPTSPFSGGAVLGDRIRMSRASAEPGVFIRSMASRGALGGIAPRTAEATYVLDAAGYSHIIIETVGVGQGEVEVVRTCDTCVVVLVPGMGDGVQAMKAGILEIADIFVINKSDHQGADRLKRELLTMINLGGEKDTQRKPTIVRTIATERQGIPELCQEIDNHYTWAISSGVAEQKKRVFLREMLFRNISQKLLTAVTDFAEQRSTLDTYLKRLYSRDKDPLTVADELIAHFRDGFQHGAK